jgi:hypothetical protein
MFCQQLISAGKYLETVILKPDSLEFGLFNPIYCPMIKHTAPPYCYYDYHHLNLKSKTHTTAAIPAAVPPHSGRLHARPWRAT